MQQIQASREKRLKEIDQAMESIKDELNKHTGGVDKLESRKRKKLKSLGIVPPDAAAAAAAATAAATAAAAASAATVADAEAMLVAALGSASVT